MTRRQFSTSWNASRWWHWPGRGAVSWGTRAIIPGDVVDSVDLPIEEKDTDAMPVPWTWRLRDAGHEARREPGRYECGSVKRVLDTFGSLIA